MGSPFSENTWFYVFGRTVWGFTAPQTWAYVGSGKSFRCVRVFFVKLNSLILAETVVTKSWLIFLCLGEEVWCEFIFHATSGLDDCHKNFSLTRTVPYLSDGEIVPTTWRLLVFKGPGPRKHERCDLLRENLVSYSVMDRMAWSPLWSWLALKGGQEEGRQRPQKWYFHVFTKSAKGVGQWPWDFEQGGNVILTASYFRAWYIFRKLVVKVSVLLMCEG